MIRRIFFLLSLACAVAVVPEIANAQNQPKADRNHVFYAYVLLDLGEHPFVSENIVRQFVVDQSKSLDLRQRGLKTLIDDDRDIAFLLERCEFVVAQLDSLDMSSAGDPPQLFAYCATQLPDLDAGDLARTMCDLIEDKLQSFIEPRMEQLERDVAQLTGRQHEVDDDYERLAREKQEVRRRRGLVQVPAFQEQLGRVEAELRETAVSRRGAEARRDAIEVQIAELSSRLHELEALHRERTNSAEAGLNAARDDLGKRLELRKNLQVEVERLRARMVEKKNTTEEQGLARHIAELEARVVEAENDLETASRAVEQTVLELGTVQSSFKESTASQRDQIAALELQLRQSGIELAELDARQKALNEYQEEYQRRTMSSVELESLELELELMKQVRQETTMELHRARRRRDAVVRPTISLLPTDSVPGQAPE